MLRRGLLSTSPKSKRAALFSVSRGRSLRFQVSSSQHRDAIVNVKDQTMKILPLFSLVGLTIAAHAGVLVDNGPLDPSAEAPLSNLSHGDGNQWQSADRFVISNNVAIRRVDFWGVYWNAATLGPSGAVRDNFTVRVFADTNGAPDVQPIVEYHVGRISRRRTLTYANPFVGPYDFYAYSASLHPAVMLLPGQYWVSIVNDIPVQEMGVTWSVGPITPSYGDLHFRIDDGEQWFEGPEGYGIAFKLRGVKRRVP